MLPVWLPTTMNRDRRRAVSTLYETIDHLIAERRAKQRHDEFTAALERMVVQEFTDAISADQSLAEYVGRVTTGDVSPYEAAEKVFGIISGRGAGQPPRA